MAKDTSPKPKAKPAPKPAKPVSEPSGKLYLVPYLMFVVLIVSYSGFLYDEAGFRSHADKFVVLKPFVVIFEAVEQFSPFIQVRELLDLPLTIY